MRLWHYELIPVLPKQMLVSQWRECIAIKRQWEKGTLKHRLVSYVMDYDKAYLAQYTMKVYNEMRARNIKCNDTYIEEMAIFSNWHYSAVQYPEHNERYLKQCLYNLEEKTDRGIISKEEWNNIEERMKWKRMCCS